MARPIQYNLEDFYKKVILLLKNDGFEKVSIEKIKQATNLSNSSIYRIFKTKDNLLKEVFTYYYQRVIFPSSMRYLKKEKGITGIIDFFRSPDFVNISYDGMPIFMKMLSLVKSTNSSKISLSSIFLIFRDKFLDCLNGDREKGLIKEEVNCLVLAEYLIIILQGLVLDRYKSNHDGHISEVTEWVLKAINLAYKKNIIF